MMTTLLFSLGFVVLFSIGYWLIRKGTPYTRSGGDTYVNRKKRKHLGVTLVVASGLFLVLGVWSQFSVSVNDDDQAQSAQANLPTGAIPLIPTQETSPDKVPIDSGMDHPQTPIVVSPSDASSALASPLPNDIQPASANASPPIEAPASPPPQFQLPEEKQSPEAELADLNAKLRMNPQDATAYGDRGNIYARQKLWGLAEKDYQASLQIDGSSAAMKFDLAQMKFELKQYDAARPIFLSLEQHIRLGDFAMYKVFLCDLFGGHEDIAAKELNVFNQVGENASYYFANVAWSLYHKNIEDARGWLTSASHIYTPHKFDLYASSLFEHGYLPIPPPAP